MTFSKKKVMPGLSNPAQTERVTSVIGSGINWKGDLKGKGGIRIEGTLEGEIAVQGLVVIGETGKVTCKNLKANTVVVAGAVKGSILSEKLEIRSTGRVWGDVVTVSFATEEGAYLRGQIRMEDKVDFGFGETVSEINESEENIIKTEED
ncbi:MAG: polymer-forming cytoskeletal protein [Anaerolineaceae bacterium]|nr:polymer-forming cytoskeletal protein [Anaerolineaceae bacterium]